MREHATDAGSGNGLPREIIIQRYLPEEAAEACTQEKALFAQEPDLPGLEDLKQKLEEKEGELKGRICSDIHRLSSLDANARLRSSSLAVDGVPPPAATWQERSSKCYPSTYFVLPISSAGRDGCSRRTCRPSCMRSQRWREHRHRMARCRRGGGAIATAARFVSNSYHSTHA
jgi:hypothetical protein